jgi:hypothetical protein
VTEVCKAADFRFVRLQCCTQWLLRFAIRELPKIESSINWSIAEADEEGFFSDSLQSPLYEMLSSHNVCSGKS